MKLKTFAPPNARSPVWKYFHLREAFVEIERGAAGKRYTLAAGKPTEEEKKAINGFTAQFKDYAFCNRCNPDKLLKFNPDGRTPYCMKSGKRDPTTRLSQHLQNDHHMTREEIGLPPLGESKAKGPRKSAGAVDAPEQEIEDPKTDENGESARELVVLETGPEGPGTIQSGSVSCRQVSVFIISYSLCVAIQCRQVMCIYNVVPPLSHTLVARGAHN